MNNFIYYKVPKHSEPLSCLRNSERWGGDTSWTGEVWTEWNCVPYGWGGKKEWKSTKCPPLAGGPKSLISRRGILLIVIPNCGFWQELSDSETRPREGCVEPADLPIIQDMFRNLLNFWDPETSSGWHWCSVFKITTSLCIGYFILCSVTAPRLKRDSEPADLSCRQPIFSAGCFALCSACFFLVMTCL